MAIIIDISTGIDGVWTFQDNGNPSDGISELRDPNGSLFFLFAHPGDSVTLLSRAGQNVTVNLTESLGTTSLTIGSLTSTTVRPDSVFVNQVSTSGIVTLTANLTITESGGDAGTDIMGNQLLLDAGTGIGTSGNPIETQIVQLEGESVTGGIHLSNIGNLQIGGSTAELRGLFTATSGDIALTNQGTIALFDSTGLQTIASAGNITLTAIGATANIASIVNNDALFATGDINLSAGQDILFGTFGVNFDNDVRAGGGIFVTAGGDFHIDGNSDMLANDAGTGSNGGIQILVGGDILIEDDTGTSASVAVSTGTGGILLATGAGGTLSLAANSASAVGAGSGGIVVSADRVLIEADSGITATGGGSITINGSSAGRNIILGSATDAAAAVELSDAELDRLFAQTTIIGTSLAGQVAVQAAITHPNANLILQSESDVLIQADISSPTSLTLRGGDTVTQNAGTTIITGTLGTIVDTPDLDAPGGQSSFAGTVSVTLSTITGNADPDTLGGTNAGDRFDGGFGADLMTGFGGNDAYVVDDAGDQAVEAAAGGIDIVRSSVSFTLGANVESLDLTGPDAINGTGNDQANTLTGNSSNNILNGGLGADFMRGGLGNDSYIVNEAGDVVSELAGQGTDRVLSAISYTLGAAVETLILTGGAAIDGTGNLFANMLFGNSGANILDGGAGADTMNGGLGNDTYIVDNADDVVFENSAAGGTDEVQSSGSVTLGSNIENLTLTGPNAVNGTGNNLDNNLTGNGAANILDGSFGADTMTGGLGNDTYVIDNVGDVAIEAAGEGTDTVQATLNHSLGVNFERLVLTGTGNIEGTGNGLANILTGNSGANALDGGGGGDIMAGGLGNDSYFVDSGLDQVIELAGGGIDTVNASLTHDLEDEVENMILTGTAAINGLGNALANNLTGNSGANILNGGAGADTMSGGLGDDTYVVDNVGDTVSDLAGQGSDAVLSSVSFTLGAATEALTLTGAGAIDGTGNLFANVLNGNSNANTLDGGGGADAMNGGGGDDTYVVDNGGDTVSESSAAGGTDEVQSSVTFTLGANVENLTLTGANPINGTGNALANILTGNGVANVLNGLAGDDQLSGNGGHDSLHGGLGNDSLAGGAGNDGFHFENALVPANVDAITDFTALGDTIFLDDAVFTTLAPGALAAGAFVAGNTALDADDRILYDATTGEIFYDADGSGGGSSAILFATVNPATAMTHLDFFVI